MRPVIVVRHDIHEALGNLEVALGASGLRLEVVDAFAGDWSAIDRAGFQPRQWSGLVVMGGPMNADETDRYPFLAAEVGWLRAALAAELPTLGICLGAQLLARSLGARVYQNPLKEIGWYEIEILPAAVGDPLFAGRGPRETVFHWHGDTFELPAHAVPLARGQLCLQQAFRLGRCGYGVQFHPEMTAEMVEKWLTAPSMCAELAAAPHVDAAEIRQRAAEALAAMRPFAQRLFAGFAELCLARPGESR